MKEMAEHWQHLEAAHDSGQAVAAALLRPALGCCAEADLLQALQAVCQLACRHGDHVVPQRPAAALLLPSHRPT